MPAPTSLEHEKDIDDGKFGRSVVRGWGGSIPAAVGKSLSDPGWSFDPGTCGSVSVLLLRRGAVGQCSRRRSRYARALSILPQVSIVHHFFEWFLE